MHKHTTSCEATHPLQNKECPQQEPNGITPKSQRTERQRDKTKALRDMHEGRIKHIERRDCLIMGTNMFESASHTFIVAWCLSHGGVID